MEGCANPSYSGPESHSDTADNRTREISDPPAYSSITDTPYNKDAPLTGAGATGWVSQMSNSGSQVTIPDHDLQRKRSKLKPGDEYDGEDLTCGYNTWRPDAMQCCNNPRAVLFWLSWFSFIQGFVVNGINNVNTTSVERRFNLGSSEVGLISSSYDIAAGLFVLPVTYLGTYGHQPRMLAFAAFVMSIGSFIMTLPHFATNPYELGGSVAELCDPSGTLQNASAGVNTTLCQPSSSLSSYLYVLMLGQFLHGFGGSILYTLGVVYIDSNVYTKDSPFYQGIMLTASAVGPAVGYLLGGYFLDIYVDFDVVDTNSLAITPDDPRWVGAWWIGFLISGTVFATIVLGMYPFPKITPDGLEALKERTSQAHQDGGEEVCSRPGFFTTWRDIPVALKILIRNPVLMFAALATVTESMVISGFATFLPKIIENQFSQTAGWAALLAGFVAVPGTVVGNMVGGSVTKCFDLKVRGMLRLNIALLLSCAVVAVVAIVRCDLANIAGVATEYGSTTYSRLDEINLESSCNSGCQCTAYTYEPVCGSDDVQYFTACHAGCRASNHSGPDGATWFSECSCIAGVNSTPGTALEGPCDTSCNKLMLFVPFFFLVIMLTFSVYVPGVNITLRCIPSNQRAFALGLTAVLYRFLGTVPGPLLFGYIFDNACLVWQDDCNEQGSCWVYDNTQLSISLLSLSIVIKLLSATFYSLALWFYKAPPEEKHVIGASMEQLDPPDSPRKLNGIVNTAATISTDNLSGPATISTEPISTHL